MVEAYLYQKRVLKALMRGKNVILLAPTGTGKTNAATLPFFHNKAGKHGALPEKALYVVPMRVLATQFLITCKKLYKEELNPDRFRETEAIYQRLGHESISIQTGESPEDPQFESMITACTIDQVLSSALGVPYSLDKRKANINVGAIASSYLILDEPHLYPVGEDRKSYKGALTTCLELLRLLKDVNRFIFMSATLSSDLVKRLSVMLDAEVIELDDAELEALNKGRSRVFKRSPEAMSAAQILRYHTQRQRHCSLVVCNTVRRAQELYAQLAEANAQNQLDIKLRLLHSRFSDEDRKQQGEELSGLLGKEQWDGDTYKGEKDVIVVATQVVEVGLDISVHTLHSENAPANSLIQRAGRCARFERQQGQVIVYDLPRNEEGQPASTLPYPAALCQSTWDALAQFDGRIMGFREEQQLINIVHTPGDLDLLDRYEKHRSDLQEEITRTLRTNDRANVSELIRDVSQIQLIIHDQPEEELKLRPWRWQSFGLHPSALMGKHWDRLKTCQQENDVEWMCKTAQVSQEEQKQQDQEEDHRLPTVYSWPPLTSPAEVPNASLIAMPHGLVTYDKDLGLVFLDGRVELPPGWLERLKAQHYQSNLLPRKPGKSDDSSTHIQTYQQHIGGLADAYHYAIHHELAYTMKRLEQLMGLAPGTIDTAIQLAIATHDLGKLDVRWQRWARAWQRLLHEKGQWTTAYQEYDQSFFFAKTDYDYQKKEQREWQKELSIKRPKHACESAMAGRKLIMRSLGIDSPDSPNIPVLRAICGAVAHHHAPQAHEYGATTIAPEARATIKAAFETVRRDVSWDYNLDHLSLSFTDGDLFPSTALEGRFTLPDVATGPEERWETWLAFVIVRALRLADQRADRYL